MCERTAKARESWGSAEGIGPGSRCVCLMSSCKGEGKREGMGERTNFKGTPFFGRSKHFNPHTQSLKNTVWVMLYCHQHLQGEQYEFWVC